MQQSSSWRENRILRALPSGQQARLLPNLRRVSLAIGQVLYESGDPMHFVYFPTSAIVSRLLVLANGGSVETSVVGNDGVIGIALFMGGGSTTGRAVVQNAGFAYRLSAECLKQEIERNGDFLSVLLRYTQSVITQMALNAACNRHHTIDQQLCRWLLSSLDRLASPTLTVTQELIAAMLGVRREGVTQAAGKLQKSGIIRNCRGSITVLDRDALEACSCECYRVIRNEANRLISPGVAAEQHRAGRVVLGSQTARYRSVTPPLASQRGVFPSPAPLTLPATMAPAPRR